MNETNDNVSTWRLGGRTVSRLGFGAMRLMSDAQGRPMDRDRAITVLRKAVELGVDHVDTAAFYFSATRSANELINTALRPYPEHLVIATKVGPGRDPSGGWLPEATPEQLRGQVEENLRQLGLDRLDLVYLRIGEGLERGAGSLAERFGALAQLRDEGLIGELGISNVTVEHLAEARRVAPVVSVQNWYGLGKRDDEVLLDLCTEQGIAFVPFFSVFGAGKDSDGTGEAVADIAKAHGATRAQIRLAWTLHRAPNVLAIPGTGDPVHVEENVAAGRIRLSSEEVATLSAR
ncbi:aldo/keto reductase [Prauserella marina]|uniref:Predicted oxidoreductase n=1 Tax=Prauserella marina TaxID=530584 RepID=A0A222VJR3_9PSEU|nr:oxidoreductase [Prauserella marina]ASR33951.1 aldo/keto reductase [Prauserella marina]PWV82555.1 aryl-alcohol dehydrogenase-like predicted oxidoreductase [Prauserella marina]SDC71895.1 Predicted oxidoreductase [Prauserella marina]